MEDNIRGFPGYHITKDGRLFKNGKEMKWFFHHNYMRCVLHGPGGIIKNVKAHRLVAEVYIPNPNNLPVVLHLNDNPRDNTIENLRWGTQKDNVHDALNKGRLKVDGKNNPMYGKRCTDNPGCKFSQRKARRLKRMYNSGVTINNIANRLNVSSTTIYNWVEKGFIVL